MDGGMHDCFAFEFGACTKYLYLHIVTEHFPTFISNIARFYAADTLLSSELGAFVSEWQ